MYKKNILLIFILSFTIFSCNISKFSLKHKDSVKTQTVIDLKNVPFNSFTIDEIEILKRYLLGNPDWDFRSEHGLIYAIKRPLSNQNETSNSINSDKNDCFTIISFGNPYNYNNLEKVTIADSSYQNIELIFFKNNEQIETYYSYLLIKCNYFNIEIFDNKNIKDIEYTQNTLNFITDELRNILLFKKQILTEGIMPVEKFYSVNYDSTFLKIENSNEDGKYIIKAAYNYSDSGEVFIKIFEIEHNYQLSEKTIKQTSKRQNGWSETGMQYFYYETEITIYEGSWLDNYPVRFELWFTDNSGEDSLLATEIYQVKAWKRSEHYRN
jgi:hypothetical protein